MREIPVAQALHAHVYNTLHLQGNFLWDNPGEVWGKYGVDQNSNTGNVHATPNGKKLRIGGRVYVWVTNHDNLFVPKQAQDAVKDIIRYFKSKMNRTGQSWAITEERAWDIAVHYLMTRWIGPPSRIGFGKGGFLKTQFGVFESPKLDCDDFHDPECPRYNVSDLGKLLGPRLLPIYNMWLPSPMPSIGVPPMTADECVKWFRQTLPLKSTVAG